MNWGEISQSERDALYNNVAAVPESTAIADAWNAASADWRQTHPRHCGLPYGRGERQTWDLFPASDPGKPCLIHMHGGYWQTRSKENFSCLAEGVSAHGWAFALAGYALAPDETLTGIVTSLRTALDWFDKHRREHGIGGTLILSGWSAGAHLAAMLLDHASVAAGFCISGLYELGPLRDTYVNAKLRLTDTEIATLSPMRLPPVQKPMTIAYGTAELPPFMCNSRHLHGKRAEAHAQGTLLPIPRANHFTILEELRRPGGDLTKAALRLHDDLKSSTQI